MEPLITAFLSEENKELNLSPWATEAQYIIADIDGETKEPLSVSMRIILYIKLKVTLILIDVQQNEYHYNITCILKTHFLLENTLKYYIFVCLQTRQSNRDKDKTSHWAQHLNYISTGCSKCVCSSNERPGDVQVTSECPTDVQFRYYAQWVYNFLTFMYVLQIEISVSNRFIMIYHAP